MKQFSFFKTLLIAAVMLLGSGSVWAETATLTITRANFPAGALAYNVTDIWNATTSKGDLISGEGDLFSNANQETLQTKNTGVSTMYHNTVALPGPITKITLTGANVGTARTYTVYVNETTAIENKTQGTQVGTIYAEPNKSTSLTLGPNDNWRYFWLDLAGGPSFLTEIVIEYEVSSTPTPTITVNPATLSGFTYVHGSGPSAAQTFTVSGSNLTANISLAAPTNYEISTTSGSGYGGSLSLTQSGGTVTETTIYARLKAGLPVGNYNSETVNITSSGATTKTVTLSGSVTAPPPPDAPVATAATAVGSTGFTANWNAVSGATGYLLSVYKKSAGNNSTIFSENFNGFTAGSPNGNAHSTDISGSLNTYTQTPGWSGDKVYQAGGTAKMGTGSALGYIVTPSIDLSADNGSFTLSFKSMAWSGDAKELKIYLNGALIHTITDLNNDASYTLKNYSIPLTGGTATSKIKFEGKQITNSRFFLEDLVIEQNAQTITPISGSPFTVTGTSKNITGLTASTTYYYTVKATSPWGVSATSNEISVTTLAASPVSTFTGSGDWHLASNWSTNSVPNFTTDVVIDGNVTVTQNYAECKNMTINPGGALTVVNIDNVLKQLVINGNLLIKSDAGGTGSVIFNSDNESQNSFTNIHISSTSTATIQRYISAADWGDAGSGWHLISSPVSVELIEGKWTPTGNDNDYDFYALDESKENEYWLNQKVSANGIYSFEPGKGYLVAYQQSDTKEFNAADIIQEYKVLSINTSDVTISGLANTTGSAYPGWHLLGNPFSSALQYDNSWTKSNIDAIIQVWNSQAGSYKTSAVVNGIIPAMNGFMVHSSGNGSITIPASKRVHNSTNWYKSGEDYILLVARDLDGTTSQSSIVRFNPAATTGYDSQFDSYFLAGFAPMFYSVSGDDLYALNTLPEQSSGLVVPFGFVKNNSSNFSIELEKSLPGSVLFLTDNKTGETVNLTEGGSYQFTSEEGDDANRFALHFAPLGIEKPGAALDAKIYAYQQVVYLAGLDTRTEVTITDLMGRAVKRVQLNGGGLSTINAAGLPKGAYIVTAVSASGSVSAKVIL